MENSDRSKQLIKGTGIYAVGSFGTKILSLIIVPIYTYYVCTADMGIYDTLMSTISLLAPLITLQISDAAYKFIISDSGNNDKYIIATLQVLIVNCTIASLIILALNRLRNIPYCIFFCAVLVLSRTLDTLQKLLRGLKKQWFFAVSGIIYTVIFLFLNLLFLCVFHRGVSGLFESAIIANICTILVIVLSEKSLRVNLFRKPDSALILSMYRYSAPLVPNYLNWWIINSSDRYIVLYFLGASATGILAIAHKFPTMLQSIIGLFNSSWQDLSISESRSDQAKDKYYSFVFEKFYRLSFTLLFFLIPFTKLFIFLVMSESYKSSCNYVPFYYLGTVFQGFSSFVGVGFLKSSETKKAFSSSVFGAVINAAVNIALIKFIGLQAAAVSTFAAFFIMWIIRMRQTKDVMNLQVKIFSFSLFLSAALVISVLSISFAVKLNIVLTVIGIVLFIIINRSELKTICLKAYAAWSSVRARK